MHVDNPLRHVELDIDIGADAKDWAAIQATEKLKPVETELRRIEEMVEEIVGEMDYLRHREQKLRDTNESTNTRVKWFGFGTTFLLIGLWVWQILYLRAYFRCVRLSLLPFACPSPLACSYLLPTPAPYLPYLLAYLAVCLAACLAGYLAGYLAGCLAVWLSGCLAVWLSGCLAVWLSGCLAV